MARGTSTKSMVKSVIWQGIAFGLGAALFVPLFSMVFNKIGLKLA